MQKKFKFNKNQVFKIILSAILVALNIILERFLAYSVWNNTVSLGFITIAFAACYLGTPYAMAVAGLGDFLGAIIKPFGPYFVGYTITNLLIGLCLGLFLKKATVIRIGAGVITYKIFCSLVLNTIWTSILYKGGIGAFWPVFISRVPFVAVMTAVEIIIISLLFSEKSAVNKTIKKTFNNLH